MSEFHDTVVYIETLQHGLRGKWLDCQRGTFEGISEREVIGKLSTKWLVKDVPDASDPNTVVLESMHFRNRYLAPKVHGNNTSVTATLDTYPFDNQSLQWVIEKDDASHVTTFHLRTLHAQLSRNSPYLDIDSSAHGRYYYAVMVQNKAPVRVYQPDSSDGLEVIIDYNNLHSSEAITVKRTYKEGISKSESSETTVELGAEIGFEIKQFLSVKGSVSKKWTTAKSTTWDSEMTREFSFRVGAGKRMKVYQLRGHYASFTTQADVLEFNDDE